MLTKSYVSATCSIFIASACDRKLAAITVRIQSRMLSLPEHDEEGT